MGKKKLILSEKQVNEITGGGSYLGNSEQDYKNIGGTEVTCDSPIDSVAGREYSAPTIGSDPIGDTMCTNFTRNNYAGTTSMPVHEEYNKIELNKKLTASPTDIENLGNAGSYRKDSTINKFKRGEPVSFDALRQHVKRMGGRANDVIEKAVDDEQLSYNSSKRAMKPYTDMVKPKQTKMNIGGLEMTGSIRYF